VEGWALVEGKLVPLAEARVPITDVGFTHGLGVYETLEAWEGCDPFANLARLRESALAIGLPAPDDEVIRREIDQVRAKVGARAWVRVSLTGDGRRIVWASAVDEERRHAPVRCATGPHVDHPLLPGSVKHRSRGAWMLEVRRRQVDEILFVDADGRFTEGTSCAVATVVDGRVMTAPWDGRILASTTLRRLLGHAKRLGIEVVRQGARPTEPFDALYVASTTRSLAPVAELDGRALPTWDPVGRRLAAADDAERGAG